MALSFSISWRQSNPLLFTSHKAPLDRTLFSSLLFYILTEKSGCRCPVYNASHLSWCKSYPEQFNETLKLKKKELDRAARKELKIRPRQKSAMLSHSYAL